MGWWWMSQGQVYRTGGHRPDKDLVQVQARHSDVLRCHFSWRRTALGHRGTQLCGACDMWYIRGPIAC